MTIRARAIAWTATAALTVGALTTGCASSSSEPSGTQETATATGTTAAAPAADDTADGETADSGTVTWTDYAAFQADVGPLPPEWCLTTDTSANDDGFQEYIGWAPKAGVTVTWAAQCPDRKNEWFLVAYATLTDAQTDTCPSQHTDNQIVWFADENTIAALDDYSSDDWPAAAIADTLGGQVTTRGDLCASWGLTVD